MGVAGETKGGGTTAKTLRHSLVISIWQINTLLLATYEKFPKNESDVRTTLLHEIFAARNFRDILISRYFGGKIEFRGILISRFRQKVYFPGI